MPDNKIISEAQKTSSANKQLRNDLRDGQEPNFLKGKSVIYNGNARLGYDDIKEKIDQGYTPMKLSDFKKNQNNYYSSMPNGMGEVIRDKMRLKQSGVDSLSKYEEAIKTGNPSKLGNFDDRNIAEKLLNLNPNQGFIGDVFEVLNRPLDAIKNSIFSIGEGQDIGQKTLNFFIGAAKGITGDADEVTWNQAMSNATGLDININPIASLGMDIAFDPLNLIPMMGNKISKFNRAKEAKLVAKDKVAFEEITEQAIKGQDILDQGHITVEQHNEALQKMGEEATKKGASKAFVDQFLKEFSFEKAETNSAKEARLEVLGDADELALTANPLAQELEDATEMDKMMARKYSETRGHAYHETPTYFFHRNIASLSDFKTGRDALHFFGRGIPQSSKVQVSKLIGTKTSTKQAMAKLIKRRAEIQDLRTINRETLTTEVKKALSQENTQIRQALKLHNENLISVNKKLDGFVRTSLGKDLFKTVDAVNKRARTTKIAKPGQDILHVDIAGDMSGFKVYTNNSNGLNKVMTDNKKMFEKLHENGNVRVPIHKQYVAKWETLTDKQKRIVQKQDYIRWHKQAFVKKHSTYYENRFDWDRYMLHSLTDEGKLLFTSGGTEYKLAGNPGSHAEQVTTPKYAEVAKMQGEAKEAAAKSLGYKSFKKLELHERQKVHTKLNEMYAKSGDVGKLKSQMSSHPRRIMGTIDEVNGNFNSIGKFFKDDLNELASLDMANLKRYLIPEAFLTNMARNGSLRFSDASNVISEISVGVSKTGKRSYSSKNSKNGLGENEKVFDLGTANGGLGFSDDVAAHLANTFGHDKIVIDDNAAYALQRMNHVNKANQLNTIMSKYSSMWKGSKLMSSGFHVRNAFGDLTLAYISGLNPFKVLGHAGSMKTVRQGYEKVAKMLSEGMDELAINPKLLDHHTEWSEFVKENAIGTSGITAQFKDTVAMAEAAENSGIFARSFKKMLKLNYNVAHSMDTMARFGIWREARKNPHIVERFLGKGSTSADMVTAVKFDYDNMTRTEGIIKKFIPFWTFAKNNTMLASKAFLKNPNRINHISNLISSTLQNTGLDSTQLPDYVKNQGYLSLEGMRNMITGKTGSDGPGDDSFLKWGSVINSALNPLESLSGVSPLISAGKTALGGDYNKYAVNWDTVSQKHNYMRAVAGDMGINAQQAESQMSMFENPFAKLGIAAPRTFAVIQELDPTPLQGWINTINNMGQDVSNSEVGAHSFLPSVIKHIDPIDMKMTQLYFEKGIISQLKQAYQTVTGTFLPALDSIENPKQYVDTSDDWKEFYSGIINENDDHRTQADWNEILASIEE